MEPVGNTADDGLFYLARVAEARGDSAEALERWQQLVDNFADDALGQLATRRQKTGGCAASLSYYKQLHEQYSRSGWASVTESAIERCASLTKTVNEQPKGRRSLVDDVSSNA
jgi:tetratricopeptide (TPR) repeat protein